MLPEPGVPTAASPVVTPSVPPASVEVTPTRSPARQLAELPRAELEALAEQYGLNPRDYQGPQHVVAAIHERRQLIASIDRDALLDLVRWAGRPIPPSASKEQLGCEASQIKAMRFGGLSQRGLVALARLRGVAVEPDDDVPTLVKRLRKQEGFFARLNRKRRAVLGSLVASILGESDAEGQHQFAPPQPEGDSAAARAAGASPAATLPPPPTRQTTIKEEIEEQGLFGGIAGRIKRSADQYVNQKLDEIEARIDRKLDEIDRRLAEWRDKEIANRLRILKITLWASVILGVASLIYTYLKVHIRLFG